MAVVARYRLKKDLPRLRRGAIFEHMEYDPAHPDRGNMGCGCMILGWLDGGCQQGWAGETYVLPGQLSKEADWFERIDEENYMKMAMIEALDKLYERVLNM